MISCDSLRFPKLMACILHFQRMCFDTLGKEFCRCQNVDFLPKKGAVESFEMVITSFPCSLDILTWLF